MSAPDRRFAPRRATAEDVAALARVETATSTQPWSEATFLTEVTHPDRSYVVACDEHGGEVVGYAGIALFPDEAHVMGIAVLPSARGHGCGRLLLTAVCRDAARADAAVTLEVRASNDVALRLYRSMGFTESGRRRAYYADGEDALILWQDASMTRSLSHSTPRPAPTRP